MSVRGLLKSVDRLSEMPALNFRGKRRFASEIGGLMTLLVFAAVIVHAWFEVAELVAGKVMAVSSVDRVQETFEPFGFKESKFLPMLVHKESLVYADSIKDLLYFEIELHMLIVAGTKPSQLLKIRNEMVNCHELTETQLQDFYGIDHAALKELRSPGNPYCINATRFERQLLFYRQRNNLTDNIFSLQLNIWPCDPERPGSSCSKLTESNRDIEIGLQVFPILLPETQSDSLNTKEPAKRLGYKAPNYRFVLS